MSKSSEIIQFVETSNLPESEKQHLLTLLPDADEHVLTYIHQLIFTQSDKDKITMIAQYITQQQADITAIHLIEKKASHLVQHLETGLSEADDKQEADRLLGGIE